MANPRPTLSDTELREVHQDLVGVVTEQARQWGDATPSVDAASNWIATEVMRPVEVSHEAEQNADFWRKTPRVISPEEQSRVDAINERLRSPKQPSPEERMRAVVRWLSRMPEWKDQLVKVHESMLDGPQKDEALGQLIARACRLYGNLDKLREAGLGRWLK